MNNVRDFGAGREKRGRYVKEYGLMTQKSILAEKH